MSKRPTPPAFPVHRTLTPSLVGRQGLMFLSLACLYSCAASIAEPPNKGEAGKKSVPVTIAVATQKTLPIQVRGTGTVSAYSTVSVKSLVEGQLTGVYFKEGQEVKRGDLLFKIDSRPQESALKQAEANRAKAVASVSQAKADYSKAIASVNQAEANRAKAVASVNQAEANRSKAIASVNQAKANRTKAIASVNQAKANRAKDVAEAKNAEERSQRYTGLYNEGAIAKDEADQIRTTAEAGKATVAASSSSIENAQAAVKAADADIENAQAAVKAATAVIESLQAAVSAADADIDKAKIDLSYNSIFSPLDGRTGSLKVNQGNLVKANDTNPLVVINQISPIYVAFSVPQKVLPEVKKAMNGGPLEVEAQIPNSTSPPVQGELSFVDSAVDTTTGTIQLKGSFTNSGGQLSPGEFVNVVLTLRKEPNAIVVPTVAVQAGQKGPFVFVVKPDKTVEIRPIKVGIAAGSETAIAEGLKPGEEVVTDGQFNLVPNAKVEIKKK